MAEHHLSHAANGTCSTPIQGWSKVGKGHSLHLCWKRTKGNSSSGHGLKQLGGNPVKQGDGINSKNWSRTKENALQMEIPQT